MSFPIRSFSIFAGVVLALLSVKGARAGDDEAASEGVVDCTSGHLKLHNPDTAGEPGRIVCFQAYVSNFNCARVNAAGGQRALAAPHWVIHHVNRAKSSPEKKERPRAWFTVPALKRERLAPTNDSYLFSQVFRLKRTNWYDRGHLAQGGRDSSKSPRCLGTFQMTSLLHQAGNF